MLGGNVAGWGGCSAGRGCCAQASESGERSYGAEREQGLGASWRAQLCPWEGREAFALPSLNSNFLF